MRVAHTVDGPNEPHCPNCGSTNIHQEEERWRPWAHDATCRDCGHHWKLSNS